MASIGEAEIRTHFRRSTPSERALRRDLAEDARRADANRTRCPRAVAVEALLNVALDHERSEGWSDRMPAPAFEQLQQMGWTVSGSIRDGVEVSEHARDEAIAFIHEHVRRPAVLMAKVAASIGARA